jgi:hypothetical protein
VRAAWPEEGSPDTDPYYALFSSPSISPVFGNNPGFTTLDIVNNKVVDIEMTFLDLNKTYGVEHTSELQWHSVRMSEFGLTEWSPAGVKQFLADLQADDALFKDWLVRKTGMLKETSGDAAIKMYENMGYVNFEQGSPKYWCFTRYMQTDDYLKCLEDADAGIEFISQ